MGDTAPGLRFTQALACTKCSEDIGPVEAAAHVIAGITPRRDGIQFYCIRCTSEVLFVAFDNPTPIASTPKLITGRIKPQTSATATDLIKYALHCQCAGRNKDGDVRQDINGAHFILV